MANRIVLFASVLLAGVALAATAAGAAPAADQCLAKPNNPSPAGKHWYYRTNRATQRKCWYLGDQGANLVAVTPPKQSASVTPDDPRQKVDPDQKTDTPPPAADARAELIDEPRGEQPAVTPPQLQPETLQGVSDGAMTLNGVVASRWPDPSTAFAANQAATVNDPTPASRIESPPPVLAADPVAAEQPSVAVDATDDVSLVLLAGAILLAVIVGGAIFMFFASRRRDRRDSSSQDHVPPLTHLDEMPWTRAREATATRPAPVVRGGEHGRLGDEIERMEQLLAITRQARASR